MTHEGQSLREPGAFEVARSRNGGAEHLRLGGELDIASVAELNEVLDSTREPQVVIELSALTFVDSSGAAALVRAKQEAESEGRSLVLRAPSKAVNRVCELLGMASVCEAAGD